MNDSNRKSKKPPSECKICGVVTEILSDHMKRAHLNKRDYKCEYCNLSFVYAFEKKVHSYIHTGEKPYSCSLCSERFSHPKAKTTHEDSHEVIEHKCRVCQKTFYDRNEKAIHEKKVHTSEIIKKHQCVECRKKFSNEDNLHDHMKTHIVNLKCKYCSIMFSKHMERKIHEREHLRDIALKCSLPIPQRARKKRGKYVKHEAYKPKLKYCLNVLHPFKCCLCSKAFIMKGELLKHYDRVHPDKKNSLYRFECPVCKKRFLTYQALYQHQVCHATEKQYHCSKCPYKTARQGDLRLHIKNHHSAALFKCEYCNKRFTLRHLYIEHLNIHKNKLFKCNFCDKSYPIIKLLRIHMFKHVEHYTCSICGMKCPKSAMSNHLSLHRKDIFNCSHKREDDIKTIEYFQESSDVLPYEFYDSSNCKICSKELGTRNAFLLHIKTHGDDELTYLTASSCFECYFCGVIFSTSQECEKHKFEHEIRIYADSMSHKS